MVSWIYGFENELVKIMFTGLVLGVIFAIILLLKILSSLFPKKTVNKRLIKKV